MRLTAAFLPLALAAAIAGADNTVRIDVDATKDSIKLEAGKILPGAPGSTVNAGWIPDEAKRPCFLVAQFATPIKAWTEVAFSFTPSASGKAMVSLKGPWKKKPGETKDIELLTVTYDDVRVEGATLVNGGFEEASDAKDQLAKGWVRSGNGDYPMLVSTPGAAKEGSKAIAAWHNGNINQTITVQAGVPVTIRAWAWSDAPVAP